MSEKTEETETTEDISETKKEEDVKTEDKAAIAARMLSVGIQCSFCELKPSTSSPRGIGVFARRRIPANTILRFPPPQSVGVPLELLSTLSGGFKTWIEENCWATENSLRIPIRGMHSLNMETYLCHRKKNNANYDHETSTYVALRDIEAGQEVTINYDQRKLNAIHKRSVLKVPSNPKKIKKRHLN